nr:MAG TPA: hypothetical protein [Caudoviricetes sp.]
MMFKSLLIFYLLESRCRIRVLSLMRIVHTKRI